MHAVGEAVRDHRARQQDRVERSSKMYDELIPLYSLHLPLIRVKWTISGSDSAETRFGIRSIHHTPLGSLSEDKHCRVS